MESSMCVYVCMEVMLLFVSTYFTYSLRFFSNKKIKKDTYLLYVWIISCISNIFSSLCFVTVKKLFSLLFPILIHIIIAGERDRHTRKGGKNQDWLWRQHRPHTRLFKARNVTHLSLLYTESLTLCLYFFYTFSFCSSRDDKK